jgi:hypothetical protein
MTLGGQYGKEFATLKELEKLDCLFDSDTVKEQLCWTSWWRRKMLNFSNELK